MHVRTHAHKVLLPPYYGGSSTLHPVKLVYQSPLHSTFFSTSLVGSARVPAGAVHAPFVQKYSFSASLMNGPCLARVSGSTQPPLKAEALAQETCRSSS